MDAVEQHRVLRFVSALCVAALFCVCLWLRGWRGLSFNTADSFGFSDVRVCVGFVFHHQSLLCLDLGSSSRQSPRTIPPSTSPITTVDKRKPRKRKLGRTTTTTTTQRRERESEGDVIVVEADEKLDKEKAKSKSTMTTSTKESQKPRRKHRRPIKKRTRNPTPPTHPTPARPARLTHQTTTSPPNPPNPIQVVRLS
ncbi:hypothetical protein GALMADRAFT_232581 [Galerina marginata CBS 339.88]|uniref:Uncharacterized protein n=1 Tax=Galerina marginata (strain CBS 339.88) TaxID=685588 RepID=A0A067SF45_GALM3|nr:hypothetical protein GALMADRAFT_232581 [Galerina marginata CBS 339.88]